MTWRKSSYSGSSTECVEVGTAPWRTSSYSGSQGECVEVGASPRAAVVRDTKNRDGVQLTFSAPAWHAFATSLKGS